MVPLEHVAVRALPFLTLEQHVHLDLSILVFGLGVVDVALAVEIGNDYNAFFVVVIVEKPSRGYERFDASYKIDRMPTSAIRK